MDVNPLSFVRQELIRDLLEDLEAQSYKLLVPLIDREDGAVLAALAYLSPKGLILDLGAGIGYSTAWLALGASMNPYKPSIIAVEYDKRLAKQLRINSAALRDRFGIEVKVVEGDAIAFLEDLGLESVGLGFVDVEKYQYPLVLDLLVPRLVAGGIGVFHNAYTPRPPESFFEKVSGLGSLVIPTPQGLLVFRKP